MVCVCEAWCVKMVCERWRAIKWCVTHGVWQSGVKDGVSKMVGGKVVCERLCQRLGVTRWCV